jgi:hypothetical protein
MFSPEDWGRVLAAKPAMDAQLDRFLTDERRSEFYGSPMAAMGAAIFGDWLRLL